MRGSILCAAVSLGLSTVDAIQLVKRSPDAAPKVIHYDIQRKPFINPVKHDRARRRKRQIKTVNVLLDNEETLYFANVSIGTPPQTMQLHIDTGSSDLWVNTPSSQLCSARSSQCMFAGTYAPRQSSTYKFLNSDFNISYVDGTGSSGDYVTDVVEIGGVELTNQQFGVGYQSNSVQGLLGIGYAINEASMSGFGGTMYPNLPLNMMQSGLINSNAYSLWLNDLDANTGSILFGGVDTERFMGELQTVPVIQEQGYYAEFIIALTAVGYNGAEGSIANNLRVPALLDSGSSLLYLPNDMASAIYKKIGATYHSNQELATIPCSMSDSEETIDFTFSSPTIRVAISELILSAGSETGDEICIVGIAPADGTTPVLGDTFLRSAYVVYDLSSNQISLAQTDFNATKSNVLEITNATSTNDGVPSASVVANAVSSVPVSTGDPRTAGLGDISGLSFGIHSAVPVLAYGVFAVMAGAAYQLAF